MINCRIKNICNLYNGNSISDSDKEQYSIYDEKFLKYISTKNIIYPVNTLDLEECLYINPLDSKFKIAPKGSTLMCIEGGSAGKKITYLLENVNFVNKLCCFLPTEKVDSKFLYYLLQSSNFISQFNLNLNGLIGGVSINQIKNFRISIPSANTQEKIADYLDKKVSKIDETIENNKKSIELLEEYKVNIITKYTTNVGEKTKIKYIGNVSGRIGFKGYSNEDLVDETTPGRALTIGGTNIMKTGVMSYEKCTYINEKKYFESPEIMLHGGEILMTKVGAGCGENSIYEYKEERVTINPNVMLLKIFDNINSKYVNYCLLNLYSREYLKMLSLSGGAQPAINQSQLKELKIILPNIQHENKIADYLDKTICKINKVIEYRKQIIEKLEEYKKSLIYEAVTGKIEV